MAPFSGSADRLKLTGWPLSQDAAELVKEAVGV
jgi:hypothetical protein